MIKDCNNDQIKLLTKNNYYTCEQPLCYNDCPISSGTAVCKKGDYEYINKKEYNRCQCVDGWKGIDCKNKDYTILQ